MDTTQQPTVQLTQEGYNEILSELKELKESKLPLAIDRVATARSFGDLSENAEYHAAREDLSLMEGRIQELENILVSAQIITPKKTAKNGKKAVSLGTRVRVKLGKKEHQFHLVGEFEADPKIGKISHQSPLGKALIGCAEGEQIEVEVPAGKVVYTIVEIE